MSNTITPSKENKIQNAMENSLENDDAAESTQHVSVVKDTPSKSKPSTIENTEKDECINKANEGGMTIDLTCEDEESVPSALINSGCEEVEDPNTGTIIKTEENTKTLGETETIEVDESLNEVTDAKEVEDEIPNEMICTETIEVDDESHNEMIQDSETETIETSEIETPKEEKTESVDLSNEDESYHATDLLLGMANEKESKPGVLLGCRIARDFSEDLDSPEPIYYMGIISVYHPITSTQRRIFQRIPAQMRSIAKLDKGHYRVQYLDYQVDDLSPEEALCGVMTYNNLFLKEHVTLCGKDLDDKFPAYQYPNPHSFKKSDVHKEELEYKSYFDEHYTETIEFDDDEEEVVADNDLVLTQFGFISRNDFAEGMEKLELHPSYYRPVKVPKNESVRKDRKAAKTPADTPSKKTGKPRKSSTNAEKWLTQTDNGKEVGLFNSECESLLASQIFKQEMRHVDFEQISHVEATDRLKTFIHKLIKNSESDDYNLYVHDIPSKQKKSLTRGGKYRAQGKALERVLFLGLFETQEEANVCERIFKIKFALIGDSMPVENAMEEAKLFSKKLVADYVDGKKSFRRHEVRDRKRKVGDLDEEPPRKIARAAKGEKEDWTIDYKDGRHYLKVWHEGEIRFNGSFSTLKEAYQARKDFCELLQDEYSEIPKHDAKKAVPIPEKMESKLGVSKGKYVVRKWVNGKNYLIGEFESQAEADEARDIFMEQRELMDMKTLSKAEYEDRIDRAIMIARAACSIWKPPSIAEVSRAKEPKASPEDVKNKLSSMKDTGIHKNGSKYRYTFYWKGTNKHVGSYNTPEKASKARDLFLHEFESKLKQTSEEAAKDYACSVVRKVMALKTNQTDDIEYCKDKGISKNGSKYRYAFKWEGKHKHIGLYNSHEEAEKVREVFLENFELKLGEDSSAEVATEHALKIVQAMNSKPHQSNDIEYCKDKGISKYGDKYRYAFNWESKNRHIGIYKSHEEAEKAREVFLEHFESKLGEDSSAEVATEHAFKIVKAMNKSTTLHDLEDDHEEFENDSMEIGDAVKHALDNSSLTCSDDAEDKKS